MSPDLQKGVAFTNLGRAFHPKYIYHRRVMWLMAMAAAAASLAAFLRVEPPLAIFSSGLNAALGSFIAWALTREIDPDRESRSALSIAWVTLTAIFIGPLPLLPAAVFIGATRFLNRIIGLPLHRFERLAILLAPLALMLYYQNWVFGLLAVFTFSLEAYYENFPRLETLYAVLAFAATLGFIYTAGLPSIATPSMPLSAVAASITLLILIKLLRLEQPHVRTDFNDQPISLPRLRATLFLTLLIAIVALHTGNAGFLLLAPLWAALLTAAL